MRHFELTDSQVVDEEKIKDMYFLYYGEYPDPQQPQQLEAFIKICKGIEREFKPTVKFLAESGRKISAVKLFKDTVGCTLAEAKEYVEVNYSSYFNYKYDE